MINYYVHSVKLFSINKSMSFCHRGLFYLLRNNHSTYSAVVNDIYILSAVRTPIGLLNGSLQQTTDLYLSGITLREASNRARIPLEDIQKIFLGCVGQHKLSEQSSDQLLELAGLIKQIPLTLVPCGLQSVVLAVEYLTDSDVGVCGAGGVDLMSHNLEKKTWPQNTFALQSTDAELKQEYSNFSKEERNAYILQNHQSLQNMITNKPFDDEMFKVVLWKQGKRNIVKFDDKLSEFKNLQGKTDLGNRLASVPGDGASVLILATGNYVKENQLTPLAKIISVANDSLSPSDLLSMKTIHSALLSCKCKPNEISQWEINDYFCDLGLSAMKEFNIDQKLLNKDGGTLTLGNPIGMSGARLICHLAHSLEVEKLGCAASNSPYGISSSVIIKKVEAEKNPMPKITMYSKAKCPLCEKVKDQLKMYSDLCEFEEIDIAKRGNERYRKMYGWDIPVLFLDGRFLCKYTLNYQLLRRRIEALRGYQSEDVSYYEPIDK